MTTLKLKSLLNIAKIDLKRDLNQILNEILTIVGQEMCAHSGSIMLVNEATGELEMVATFGLPDDYIEKVYRLSNILAESPIGIGVVEDRKLSWTNESMMKMFGVENEEDYIGQSARILYASEEEYERVGQLLYKNRTDKVVQFDAQLKRSEERLRVLFEYAPNAYFLYDLEGNLLDVNKVAEGISGYNKDEVIGKNLFDLKILPPEQKPKADA